MPKTTKKTAKKAAAASAVGATSDNTQNTEAKPSPAKRVIDKREQVGKYFYALPPAKFCRKEYIDIWRDLQQSNLLKDSTPALQVEGGFAWPPDDKAKKAWKKCPYYDTKGPDFKMQIRSYGLKAPHFEDTWEKTEEAWKNEAKLDEEVPFVHDSVGFFVWRLSNFTPQTYLDEFQKVLEQRGWTTGDRQKIDACLAKKNEG